MKKVFVGVGLSLMVCGAGIGCDDLTVPQQPGDGGASTSSSSGNTAVGLPPGAPATAVPGQIVSAFSGTLATWGNVDAAKAINGFGWNVPLASVNALIQTKFDTRVWMEVPKQVTDEMGITGFAFDHLPAGHIPVGVYDVPHWEFHLIFQDFKEIQALDCSDPTLPPPTIVPQPYNVLPPPDNCFPAMGIHAVNGAAPEFNGQKFVFSNLMVFYRGNGSLKEKGTRVVSFEPKVTSQFLTTRKSFTIQLPQLPPQAIGREVKVPTTVTAEYDPTNDTFIFNAAGLVPAT